MTKDEILQSCHTLKECYVKEYINPSCFGHLTINFNGEVCCLNERIESLRDMDLPYIINKWVGSQGCLWYLARNKRCCCKECAIQVLCPSVSIYELLNIYKCPCTVQSNKRKNPFVNRNFILYNSLYFKKIMLPLHLKPAFF